MKHCGRGEDRHAEGLSLDVKVLGQLIGPPAPDKPDAIALHTAIEKHHGAALPWCGLGRNAGCGGVDGRGGWMARVVVRRHHVRRMLGSEVIAQWWGSSCSIERSRGTWVTS